MESTQNKIYEIEESAIIGQNLKATQDEDLCEEMKNGKATFEYYLVGDYDLYAD